MASDTSLTILFGFSSVFWGLGLLEAAGKIQTSQVLFARAGGAFLLAVVTTFAITLLLLFAYVRALGRANPAGGGAGGRFLGCLAKATLAATMASLVAGAVLLLVADGRNDDGVGWLNTKK